MQINRLFCMGWIKIKLNITLNSFNRYDSFEELSTKVSQHGEDS